MYQLGTKHAVSLKSKRVDMSEAKRSAQKKSPNKLTRKLVESNETGARKAVLEDLFYDFHRSRRQIYLMNFFRGLFFGFGSVIGATLLIGLTIWLLGRFSYVFPPLADFINQLVETMQSRR